MNGEIGSIHGVSFIESNQLRDNKNTDEVVYIPLPKSNQKKINRLLNKLGRMGYRQASPDIMPLGDEGRRLTRCILAHAGWRECYITYRKLPKNQPIAPLIDKAKTNMFISKLMEP